MFNFVFIDNKIPIVFLFVVGNPEAVPKNATLGAKLVGLLSATCLDFIFISCLEYLFISDLSISTSLVQRTDLFN